MSKDFIKGDKSKWLSSHLNVAVNRGFPELKLEENFEKFKTEKYNWLPSHLKRKSKSILPENPLEDNS